MRVDWNKKYTTIAVYAFIVICLSIVFFLCTSQISAFAQKISDGLTVLQPFLFGLVIAYLLNFIYRFIKGILNKVNYIKDLKDGTKKTIGIILTYVVAIGLVILFIQVVLPQVIDSIIGIVDNIPIYMDKITTFVDKIFSDINLDEKTLQTVTEKLNNIGNSIMQTMTKMLPAVGNMLKSVTSRLWNFILGFIISVYLLIDKDKFIALTKKCLYAILPKKNAALTIELGHNINTVFGKFLGGKILDSFIIGVLTFFVLTIFKMPYTILISVIVGITNIIPFFGPFFGAVPSVIIILLVSPIKAFWFLIIILVIQQIDGNIIGPKILGDSVGISPFWILFSLLIAGKFLGVVGMIIGVPMFVVFYSIVKEFIEKRLKLKEMPVETEAYGKKE